jgi:hypothetical protein
MTDTEPEWWEELSSLACIIPQHTKVYKPSAHFPDKFPIIW